VTGGGETPEYARRDDLFVDAMAVVYGVAPRRRRSCGLRVETSSSRRTRSPSGDTDGGVPDRFEVSVMHGESRSTATSLREGTPVEVATRFTGSWTGGFEVVALHSVGCRVRRVSDGAVLPIDFGYPEVRPAPPSRRRS
jgi:hypothetical protein